MSATPGLTVYPTASLSNDELRKLWRAEGGSFYGPIVEHGDMPEAKLLPFLRRLIGTTADQQKEGAS